ncbi:hypothetical protein H4R18_000869 [Coemansia javaensis]|uniref:phospholipase D n=1 Tax=Coemansia javaensis TaxID=2761396 RepID=A0A9W8HGV9_9FUNG|nr:hypothetical protein H4R18_000869 [Coemansia javaensis]
MAVADSAGGRAAPTSPQQQRAGQKEPPVSAPGPAVFRSATIANGARAAGDAPVSPLVAASTAGEHYPTHQLSYAHQQRVSGWDKVFAHISQRAETAAEDGDYDNISSAGAQDRLLRVPGIGEDPASDQGDVQYVSDAYSIQDGFGSPPPPRPAGATRLRSDTGASSLGSAAPQYHGSIASTTALSPAQPPQPASTAAQPPPPPPVSQAPTADSHRYHPHTLFQHRHHDTATSGGTGHASHTPSALVARLLGHGAEADDEAGAAGPDPDADADADHQGRMEELRGKLRRAVFKAGAVARRAPRQLQTTAAKGTFPFLQDAMFVPMFHFARDEHGHRALPVIFDAMQLSITTPWSLSADNDSSSSGGGGDDDDEENHFAVRILLQYGDVKWVLHRRLNDFISLHTMLTLRRLQGHIAQQLPAFPQQFGYALEKARMLKPGQSHQEAHDRLQQAVADRSKALEAYLLRLLRALNMRPAPDLCGFLELSAVSLMKDVGWKGKEGYLDRRVEHTTGIWCTPHELRRWSRQWVVVRDSFVAFCNHISDPYPHDILLADPQFDIKFRKKKGHNPLFPYRITLSNQYRRIQLRSDSERAINEWRASFASMKNSSAWAVPHRFASFAPIRDASRVIWFVDGDDYFFALSEALENATDCIYISDWWLSPEVHLRRPPALHEEYRLDRLLKRKAEEGVKIYVSVYKEVTVSLTINSAYTKRKLQSLHPNIMVQRHPDHLAGGTMFWAHHEKIAVVDNTFAFIGGLDLCWGRYDTQGHRLADYFLPHRGTPYTHLQNFFGQDYNNARIHDFTNVNDYEETLIDRRTTARMPWHDVHMAMIGQPARDVARHFIQRWNFVKSCKGMNKPNMPFLMPKGEYSATRNDLQYRGTCRTQVLRSSAEWSMGITKESSIHTAYCEMIRDAKHFIYIENQFFVSNAREDPDYTIKNRIAEALVDRIKRAHHRGEKFHVIVVIPLMPAFEGDVNAAGAATLKLVMHWQYQSICRGDHSIAAQLDKEGICMHDYIRFFGLRNYDVIRRYADGAMKQDLSAVAAGSNMPAEAGPTTTMRAAAAAAAAANASPQGTPKPPPAAGDLPPLAAGKPHMSPPKQHHPPPPPQAVRTAPVPAPSAPSSVANGSGSMRPAPSLSFSNAAAAPPSIAPAGTERSMCEYGFQRPDEAFAEDNFPMRAHPARHSQEASRRSQDRHVTHAQPRRSLNLPPRRPTLRHHTSMSGLRGFLLGDRDEGRARGVSAASSVRSATSDDEDAYGRRVDGDGRRKTALRYLVRGTEHIKQYGWQRRHHKGAAAGTSGAGMHGRMYKHGFPADRRDSDSEMGSSDMRVDMDDVENYVHPSPQAAAAAHGPQQSHQQQQPLAVPPAATVLPEFTGAEYMRERARADASAAQGADAPAPPPEPLARTHPSIYPPQPSAYPPPPPARAGPQILEHEIISNGRRASVRAQPAAAAAPAAAAPAAPHHPDAARPSGEGEGVRVEPEVVDQIVTELVYVHCKLMIVDDRYVVMGSANINDRSMCGNRDSEIAMVIEDTEAVVTTMDGRPYQAARFAHSLRVQLCQEHCGLLDETDQMRYVYEMYAGSAPIDTARTEAEKEALARARAATRDPLSDEFLALWWTTASTNARVFRDVFRCVPDDTVETFDQYKKFIPGHDVPYGHALPGRSTADTLAMLRAVRGHLVPMPLNFLKSENLGAKLGDREILVPVEVFTRAGNPVYLRSFGEGAGEDRDKSRDGPAEVKHHCLAYTSCDVIDERLEQNKTGDLFVGLLQTVGDLAVYGYATSTGKRIILIATVSAESAAVRAAQVREVCQAVHAAYVALACNPFAEMRDEDPLDSPGFDAVVARLGQAPLLKAA